MNFIEIARKRYSARIYKPQPIEDEATSDHKNG